MDLLKTNEKEKTKGLRSQEPRVHGTPVARSAAFVSWGGGAPLRNRRLRVARDVAGILDGPGPVVAVMEQLARVPVDLIDWID